MKLLQSMISPNEWDFDSSAKKTKHFDAVNLDRDLHDGFAHATSPFLKQRYWFQLERSYFFNSNPKQAIDLFETYQKDMPRNTIYYRALAYAAGAYYKLKEFGKANYYYSRVYDSCAELRTVAHYSFHPQEESDWKATLALCRNTTEQATLWQMSGIFYADEKRAIAAIYQIDPQSNKLDLLLARAVNKYEQKFNENPETEIEAQHDTSQSGNKALHLLIYKIAKAGNTSKPWIWNMAAGYLNTLDKNYPPAKVYFSQAEKTLPPQKSTQAQLRLLKLINTIGEAKKIDPAMENKLLNDLVWLTSMDKNDKVQIRHADAIDWIRHTLSIRYKNQHEPEKAECFVSNTAFYADNRNVESMKSFLNKSVKSPFEKFCSTLSVMKLRDLYEYQAIQLTYAGDFSGAIQKIGGGKTHNRKFPSR